MSATRCMLPLSAYVSPLEKSISRFESSASALWRLTITGTESLNLSAIDWASLKLRGTTRCTFTDAAATASSCARRLPPDGRMTAVCAPGCPASGSDQSSNSSRWRARGFSRRTFWRSRSYVRSSSSSAA